VDHDGPVPEFIDAPKVIPAAGDPPKLIEEYIGRANTGTERISIARMKSPAGWSEPWQKPEFDEYTVVLDGELRVEFEGGHRDLGPGRAVLIRAHERVRYSSPNAPAQYVAICLPAFDIDTVHREE